ncbi:amino acid adenylation domain-containing protein [Streptomyces sp. CA-253872]|uniref:amino acid adenylation domain-containing protein n=1 Tax=Streptomyces sp. CA-253872 TaxID=3240067 RepID=UPI003D8C0803
MNTTELLAEYAAEGIELWEEEGRLRFRAPRGLLTGERRERLLAHKEEILRHLAAAEGPVLRPDPAARHEPFPLTPVQSAYLLGRADGHPYGGVACQAYVELGYPELDAERVTRVWRELTERHDMLRAVVHEDGYQQVLPQVPAPEVLVADAAPGQEERTRAGVRARMTTRRSPADRWPLFDLAITRAPDGDRLHVGCDMLVVDHAGLRLLLAEFDAAYRGTAPEHPPLGLSFRDCVLARRAQAGTPAYERDRAYWAARVDELPPAPELPLAERWAAARDTVADSSASPATPPVTFRRLERLLGPDAAGRLGERAARRGLTLSGVLLTAYAEAVGRWSRGPRFTLNVPTADRPPLHPDIGRVVGDFTSLELLAVDLTVPESFAERTRTLTGRLLEDLEHTRYGGTEVLAELSRRAGAPVLMPVVFTSALGGRGTADLPVAYAATRTPQVWLDCQAMERGDALALSWDVREGVLPEGVAEDMFAGYTALVEALAAPGDAADAAWERPADLPLPPAQGERRAAYHASEGPLPTGLLHEAFLARAAARPDALAVEAPGRALTYRALARRAGEVAARLRALGLEPGERVAVWMDKGWEQTVAVLGTLLAGGAYLPVDTAQPVRRRDTILRDAAVRHVLTQSWLAELADLPGNLAVIAVDTLPEAPADPLPTPGPAPDDLAYVIYTSGSTGTPKGVMISHRAALNTITDMNRRYRIGAGDKVLGVAGLGFDLSVYDLFGPLSAGGTLVLPEEERRGDPSHWAELLHERGVTVWNSVPGQLQMLCDWVRSAPGARQAPLRLALLSGDWIPVALPEEARSLWPSLEVVALGGATEAAIWSIAHPAGDVDTERPSIPYGRPLTNQRVHVLDHTLRPCPEWVPGELYLAGAGLALGYLGDEERTAERFVRHPLTGERLYRTGDLGRQLPDGTVEFLGREDTQVKIRGYRVELAEVEAAVRAHPSVGAGAVVVDDGASGGRRLAAFVESGRRAPGAASALSHEAAEAAREAITEAGAAVDGARLGAFIEALDATALDVMAHLIGSAGLCTGPEGHTADQVCAGLRATPRHRHLVRRWLRALTAHGRLAHDTESGTYARLTPVDGAALDTAWRTTAALEAEVGWSTELLGVMRTCADRLPELLAGEVEVAALLFPGAATGAADAAYRDNLAIRHLNRGVVAALTRVAAAHTGEERLRVLEVGGGVGGTTAELVPALDRYGVDYLFTDASPFFVDEARERFAEQPWVRSARFDLDQDPRAQGLVPNSFDVVVCANTLHAASDTDAALERLRALLVPGGRLVFVENTRDLHPPLLVSMEFLELAGAEWTDERPALGQSFLTGPQWHALLARHGATDVVALPGAGEPLALTGQELFLAVLKDDRVPVTEGELVRDAANRLPAYMVPSVWQLVDALPRTANGKTDRAALRSWLPREAAPPRADEPAERPMDALEQELAALWAELLAVPRVGAHEDFFDLGGDSLLVARMVGRLRERVPYAEDLEWEAVLRHLLRRPTVAGLAAFLRDRAGEEAPGPVAPADPLVHLHGSRSAEEPVTVLVHAGTGTVMPYRALVTEIRRRSPGLATVVGLEVPGLDRYLAAPPEGLIEQLAAEYAQALTREGARRFHVVGYCLGGLVATEVARSLAESGAVVESLTVISSHSPRFRLDDELLSEYAFAVMMGIDPADLGFPADENRVAAAADAVLAQSPGVLRDGGLAALEGEFADVGACFAALAAVPRETRIVRMCEAVPAGAGNYAPDHMTRLFSAFRQSVFAITRYAAEPYAGDITFLRHDGAYPFPGSKAAVTTYWEELTLGDLTIVDIGGDHFSCLAPEHAPAVLKLIDELTSGAVTR